MSIASGGALKSSEPEARSSHSGWIAGVLVLAIVAVIQRYVLIPNADVAWMLTVVERHLDGARIYVDVIETNPPVAVYLYLPAVLLAKLTGIRAEWTNVVVVFASAIGSLTLCAAILRRSSLWPREFRGSRFAWIVATLLVLPAATFGEREHFALIAILPYLCVQARRGAGETPSSADAIGAGLFCAVTMLIKPHFVVVPALVTLVNALQTRNLRLIVAVENVVAAILALLYVLGLFWFVPAFWFTVVPMATLAYIPVKYGPLAFLRVLAPVELAIAAMLAEVAIFRRRYISILHLNAGVAALGFFLAALAQGKGFAYHYYPAVALALMIGFDVGAKTMREAATGRALAAIVFAFLWTRFDADPDFRLLAAAVRREPVHERVISIGYSISAAAVVAREADARWVGSLPSQLLSDNAKWILDHRAPDDATREALLGLIDRDRATLARDIARGDPDVILVQRGPEDWLPWARENPDIAAALAVFAPVGRQQVGGSIPGEGLDIEIWRRNSPSATAVDAK
jgi:hypothetical protein